MSDEDRDIAVAQGFFASRGISTERISPGMYPGKGKLPDLHGEFGKGGFFFSEVKSPRLDEAPGGGFAHHTTMSKLLGMLRKARKQFESVNPKHLVPNVLIWVSRHFQLNWSNFVDTFHGYIGIGDHVLRDFRGADFVRRTERDWRIVDLHVWLQVNEEDVVFEMKLFRLASSEVLTPALLHALEPPP